MDPAPFAILLASLTLLNSTANAENRFDGELAVIGRSDDPALDRTVFIRNSGCATQPRVRIAQIFFDAARQEFGQLFANVRLHAQPGSEGAIDARLEIQNLDVDFVGGEARVIVQVALVLESAGRPLLSERDQISETMIGYSRFNDCDTFFQSLQTTSEKAVSKAIRTLATKIKENPQHNSRISEVFEDLRGPSSLDLAGLQSLFASYRISESEGVIRKKPAAKGGTVRKLALGSVVQVIGKLPTGWLQVAREGEAIGWIHEGSVTAMSVQSQPATAVVTSAPTKPTKPSPAPVAVPPAPTFAAAPAPATESFPTKPVAVSFPRGKPNPDDIAVIIGNANYKATAKDIPDVIPAYADAEGMKRYATQALGIKEENVIFIKDAKLVDFVATFGTGDNHKGKLFNWVKPGQTSVFVFYSGHGAPSGDGSSSYLVPVDAQGALIELSAYPIKTLYGNLSKLPAKSVTVVLEACFSGSSQAGTVIKNASPVFQKALQEAIPPNLNVITAASGTQIASWEQDKSHGLFTKHYLLGMAGAADRKPYGDGDGKVTTEELTAYLKGTMSYMAQRYYGREQSAQFAFGK
jgi:hypothetical protein